MGKTLIEVFQDEDRKEVRKMVKKLTASEELTAKTAALEGIVAEVKEQVDRYVEGGVKVAGTRARAALQDLKDVAQALRKLILEIRDEGR